MTVDSNDRRKEYAGNGVATVFDGPKCANTAQIKVYFIVGAGSPVEQTTGFSVIRNIAGPSKVTFSVPPAIGILIRISRVVPYSQEYDITNQSAYLPENMEQALDNVVYQVQQIVDDVAVNGGISPPSPGGPGAASDVSIADAGGYYASVNVEGALQEAGAAIGGKADKNLPYLTAGAVGSLPNSRSIIAGTNMTITDSGPGGSLTFTASSTASLAWASITGVPTTIAGYGITDAAAKSLAYMTIGASASLPGSRRFTAGENVSVVDGGAGSTYTVSASGIDTISSFAFIPLAQQAAIIARTSTYDCSSDINAAIAAAKTRGARNIYFPAGEYCFASVVTLDSSGLNLIGCAYGDNPTTGATVFKWTGTAPNAANGMIYLTSPTGAGLKKQLSMGLKDIFVKMNGVGDYGIVVKSINNAIFDNVSAQGATTAQWLLSCTAGPYAEAGDTQGNLFTRCGFFASGSADGFRMDGNSGNFSYNIFSLCAGVHENGAGVRSINSDNNTFHHLRIYRSSGTGWSIHIDGNGAGKANDYLRFINSYVQAPIKLAGVASGFADPPVGLRFEMDSSNSSEYPGTVSSSVDAGVRPSVEIFGDIEFSRRFGPIAIGENIYSITQAGLYTNIYNPLSVWAGSGGWVHWGSAAARYKQQPTGTTFAFVRDDSPGNGSYSFDGAASFGNSVALTAGNMYKLNGAANITGLMYTAPNTLLYVGGTFAAGFGTNTTGFNGTAPVAKPTVTGSRGGNAALASLLTALASTGLLTDSST